MKTIPALVLAAVVAVGLLAGVTTYQLASGPADPGSPAASPAVVATPAARTHQPRTRVRWAPCKPPAVRRGKVCVTEEVRTVVVPAPAPAPAPVAPAAPVAQPVRTDDGDRAEHADDDRGTEHESEAEHENENENEHENENGDDAGEHEDD